MKSYYLSKVFFLLLLFFGASEMYAADDWENYVETPCDDLTVGLDETIIWDGPQEFTFCTDSITNPEFQDLKSCIDSCCYTIIYYESWTAGDYQVYIAGMFWDFKPEGAEGCEFCDKAELERYFHWNLIQKQNYEDEDFRDSLDNYSQSMTFYLYSPGHCYSILDSLILCDSANHCCRRPYTLYLEPDENENDSCMYVDSTMDYEGMYQSSCDSSCVEVCDDYELSVMPVFIPDPDTTVDFGCDMPCDTTIWSDGTEDDIPVPDCPGCVIDIIYKYRETQDPECNPQFSDYEITSIVMSGDSCTNCSLLSEQEIFQFALGYLLKYGPLTPPGDGQCQTSWRTVNATCWKLFPNGKYEKCPDTEGCCWSQYRICNNGGSLTYTKIDGSNVQDTCWKIVTHICGFVCDLLPLEIYQDPMTVDNGGEHMNGKYSFAVPNPSSESTEILFDYRQIGKVELTVFDKLGRNILSTKFDKTSRILKMPIKNDFPSGVYSYIIKINNKIIDTGSFVVIK